MSETHAESVLIVDDHPLFRKGLAQLLKTVNGFRLVGEAAGGVEGMEMARELQPDLVLLDLNMRDLGGLVVIAGSLFAVGEVRPRFRAMAIDPLVVTDPAPAR